MRRVRLVARFRGYEGQIMRRLFILVCLILLAGYGLGTEHYVQYCQDGSTIYAEWTDEVTSCSPSGGNCNS